MEEWKNGKLEEWNDGRMEEWKNGRNLPHRQIGHREGRLEC